MGGGTGAGGAGVLQTSTGAIAVCPLETLATIFIWLLKSFD